MSCSLEARPPAREARRGAATCLSTSSTGRARHAERQGYGGRSRRVKPAPRSLEPDDPVAHELGLGEVVGHVDGGRAQACSRSRTSTASRSRRSRSSAPNGSSSSSSRGARRQRPREGDPLGLAAGQRRDVAPLVARCSPTGRAARRPGRRPGHGCVPRRPAARSRRCRPTSRCGNSSASWNTSPNRRRWAGTPVTSSPSQRTRPASGVTQPGHHLQQRRLARPAGPSRHTTSSGPTPSATRSRTVRPPNATVTPSTASPRRRAPDALGDRHRRPARAPAAAARRPAARRPSPTISTVASASAAPYGHLAGAPEQADDLHRQRRGVRSGPGRRSRRTHRARRRRRSPRPTASARPEQRQRRPPATRAPGRRPSVAATCRSRGSTERSTGSTVAQDERAPRRACAPAAPVTQLPRRSSGGRARTRAAARSPTVTADVPSGSIAARRGAGRPPRRRTRPRTPPGRRRRQREHRGDRRRTAARRATESSGAANRVVPASTEPERPPPGQPPRPRTRRDPTTRAASGAPSSTRPPTPARRRAGPALRRVVRGQLTDRCRARGAAWATARPAPAAGPTTSSTTPSSSSCSDREHRGARTGRAAAAVRR